MIWAHMLSNMGAFTNPHDYREVMKAVVGYDPRSVDEVIAAQKLRDEERDRKAKADAKRPKGAAPLQVGAAVPKQTELEKMQALLSMGQKRPDPVNLDEESTPS